MMGLAIAAAFTVGAVMGIALARTQLLQQVAVLQTTLEQERLRASDKHGNEQQMVETFDRVARATLEQSTQQLVKTAEGSFRLAQESAKGELDQQRLRIEHLVKPVQENIERLEQHISASERERKEEYGGLFAQMQGLAETNQAIQTQAANLGNVLRASTSQRGKWGEVHLRRVVELAGMHEHCDFAEQPTATSDGARYRADLVVFLPGSVQIPIDAKVPFDAYERSHGSNHEDEKRSHLAAHAKAVRQHVDNLHKRAYWDAYVPTCGFTVMFVPNEAILDAACSTDPQLWEFAAQKQILLATPATLMALLKMAAVGWSQQAQTENAGEIARTGRILYKRLVTAGDHVDKVGRSLRSAIGSYNSLVGSLETRVMPSARKLSDLGAGDSTLGELDELTEFPRPLRSDLYVQTLPGEADEEEAFKRAVGR